jgi:phenylpyruvate tautomerase PptA (4-oxalocrotonate tautomerase family)
VAQVKIYGRRDRLRPRREQVSSAIHRAVVDALQYPVEKRAHRFLYFDAEDYLFPPAPGRTDDYTIIEISLFEGRTPAAKKRLIRALFENLAAGAGLAAVNVEITLTETPRANWGLHGVPGDELALDYTVEV